MPQHAKIPTCLTSPPVSPNSYNADRDALNPGAGPPPWQDLQPSPVDGGNIDSLCALDAALDHAEAVLEQLGIVVSVPVVPAETRDADLPSTTPEPTPTPPPALLRPSASGGDASLNESSRPPAAAATAAATATATAAGHEVVGEVMATVIASRRATLVARRDDLRSKRPAPARSAQPEPPLPSEPAVAP
ncbi:MAG: hypothetical protein ACOC0P_07125, partial [Planctomycetota bacterium]